MLQGTVQKFSREVMNFRDASSVVSKLHSSLIKFDVGYTGKTLNQGKSIIE